MAASWSLWKNVREPRQQKTFAPLSTAWRWKTKPSEECRRKLRKKRDAFSSEREKGDDNRGNQGRQYAPLPGGARRPHSKSRNEGGTKRVGAGEHTPSEGMGCR